VGIGATVPERDHDEHLGIGRVLRRIAGRQSLEIFGTRRRTARNVVHADVIAEPGVGLGLPGEPQQRVQFVGVSARLRLQFDEAAVQCVVHVRVGRVRRQTSRQFTGPRVL